MAASSASEVPASLTVEERKTLRQNVIAEKVANEMYLRQHKEVQAVLSEAIRLILLRRPADPVEFVSNLLATADLKELAAVGVRTAPPS